MEGISKEMVVQSKGSMRKDLLMLMKWNSFKVKAAAAKQDVKQWDAKIEKMKKGILEQNSA